MNERDKPMTGEHAALIFAQGLTAKFADCEWPYNPEFSADLSGKKYIRIVNEGNPHPEDQTTNLYKRQRSCHAYVDRETGEVYKSAGWSGGPAKVKGKPDPRYPNVWEALVNADRNGGYLYK